MLTFIGESARSRMRARYSVVVRKMNRTENSRKRWYLARSALTKALVVRNERREAYLRIKEYSVPLLDVKPCSYESPVW